MKKFLASFILSVFLINVTTPKAEAGVGLVGVGTTAAIADFLITDTDESNEFFSRLKIYGAIEWNGLRIALYGSAIGGLTAIFAPSLGVKIIHGSLILDADGSLPRSELVQNLSQTYPFVDNQGVIEDLADSINQKYLATKKSNEENVVVRFNVAEVQDIFAAADLTDAQLAKITEDLK